MSKRTGSSGLGSLGSGALTAGALAVQTGLSAVVGVIVARHFGRTAETDGFFASYGVFATLVLAATAARVTTLPSLARARDERRLGGALASYALAAAVVIVPLVVIAAGAAGPIAALLTGFGPDPARDAASATLPWMVLAAAGQLFAGLGASALAALDDYRIAAAGFVAGSVGGLLLILLLIDGHGIEAVSWGMALNGVVSCAVPGVALAWRARADRMPRSAVRPADGSLGRRLRELGAGVSFPLALQAIYLICLPLAAHEGVGSVTSLSYAYLIGSAVVAVTASSLGLVTSVPLTRAGVDPAGIARHVVSSSWIAVLTIGAVAGVFADAGGLIATHVLGSGYERHVGSQLGTLVVVLAPWMVASVGVSVVFPVLFVVDRGARLPVLAAATVVAHLAIAFAGRALFGLDGLAVALAVTTGLCLVAMLAILHASVPTLVGLGTAALLAGGLAAAVFGAAQAAFGPVVSAAAGLAAYVTLIVLIRPPGLRRSWRYLRALG